jgi:signal transduction histidine kinase
MRSTVTGAQTTRAKRLWQRLAGSPVDLPDFPNAPAFATITQPLPGQSTAITPSELFGASMLSASLNAILAALRWGAVMLGLVFAAQQAAAGELRVVGTVAIAIFMTSWRTIVPLKLGDPTPYRVGMALADVAIFSLAVSLSDGFGNPMVGTLFVAVGIAGLGWGLAVGVAASVIALTVTTIGRVLGPDITIIEVDLQLFDSLFPGALAMTALAGAAVLPGVALNRLLELEGRRKILLNQRDKLAQTNQLLAALNSLARTLPSSLDLADVVQNTRRELVETFDAKRMAVLTYEDGLWSPVLQDGFNLPPELPTGGLPDLLRRSVNSVELLRVNDLSLRTRRTGSGLYSRLVINNVDTGLLAVEHDEPNQFTDRDAQLLAGMASVLALTLSNARSFRRLRSLAADEERSRIARDLHDRLGQYLTYIALELERINTNQANSDLKELHEDVQSAISEFRDTLLELRTAVSADKPLSLVLGEVVGRFRARSQLNVTLVAPRSADRLPARVENELLRIAQEALTNIEKHARAANVHVAWTITDGEGVLVVQDDGRGFDPSHGIRGNAYGLVGMRERASSVGALLTISSKPGEGTVITVQSSQTGE